LPSVFLHKSTLNFPNLSVLFTSFYVGNMVAFRFEDSRSGDSVRGYLVGFRGILLVDGYAGYNKLIRKEGGNDGKGLTCCWAHR